MQYNQLQKEIASSHIRHCYLFHGDEKFLIEKAVGNLRDKIIGPDISAFNYQVFYGSQTSGAAISQSAMTYPLFSGKKFLLIKEAGEIPDTDNLLKLIGHTPEHCYLVFLADKVDFRLKFFSALRKAGTDVKFWRPFENKIPGWLHQRVSDEGLRISPDAVDCLIGLCGNDLMRLENELEKVFLYIGGKKTIDAVDVEKVGAGWAIHNIFELTDSIGSGNLYRAVGIVNKLIGAGEHPLKIMALISRQFRNIWQGKEMLARGDSPEMVGQKLRVAKFSLRNFLGQTRRFDESSLGRIFKTLLHYDLRFKSSRVPQRLLMELLILDICT